MTIIRVEIFIVIFLKRIIEETLKAKKVINKKGAYLTNVLLEFVGLKNKMKLVGQE